MFRNNVTKAIANRVQVIIGDMLPMYPFSDKDRQEVLSSVSALYDDAVKSNTTINDFEDQVFNFALDTALVLKRALRADPSARSIIGG